MDFDVIVKNATSSTSATIYKIASMNLFSFFKRHASHRIVSPLPNTLPEEVDLAEPLAVARLLTDTGIIERFGRARQVPGEPPIKVWWAICRDSRKSFVRGATSENDSQALFATLAEALERYIWWEETDYFKSPVRATIAQIKKYGPFLSPDRFVSFSDEQRGRIPRLDLRPDAQYQWIKGTSLTTGEDLYLPAQTVSGVTTKELPVEQREPLIRLQNTVGLATWSSPAGARLSGALEAIERDAYMIMWFNQLILPRISLKKICAQIESLSRLVNTCARSNLKIHALQLLTDAPAHAICAVIEDLGGSAPRFSFGLKAHRSLAHAIEDAIIEALRGRIGALKFLSDGNAWDPKTPVEMIGHRERMYYWTLDEHAEKLAPLITGEERDIGRSPWENDSPEGHLDRIIDWCRSVKYDFISVSLGTSAKNSTRWSIEMVVIPELQQMHLHERLRALGGERWKNIPKKFGYATRAKQFIDAPHPFS